MQLQIKSAPADKPKIVFHSAMMAIQNFAMFVGYFLVWGALPRTAACADTNFGCELMSMTCVTVAFTCVGMAFGGYTDDPIHFWIYWVLHAMGGVGGYSGATYLIPTAWWSEEGRECKGQMDHVAYPAGGQEEHGWAGQSTNGDRLSALLTIHLGCYWIYVYSMLAITYFSFLKPSFLAGKGDASDENAVSPMNAGEATDTAAKKF